MMKKITKKDALFILAVSLSAILFVAEVISDRMVSDIDTPDDLTKSVPRAVAVLAIITFAVCTAAVFIVERRRGKIALFLAVVALIIFGLAGFAYSFADYGSYYK